MARPAAYFGISRRPYQSYFPSYLANRRKEEPPPTLQEQVLAVSPQIAPFMAYDPDLERRAIERGQAQAMLDNMDLSSQEGITGLQRLIGKGYVTPQQAQAMLKLQQVQSAPSLSKTHAGQLQKAYTEFAKEISDEEKETAFKKGAGRQIAKGEGTKRSEDWRKAWHMVADPRREELLATMKALEQMGSVLPPNFQELRKQLMGGTPPPRAVAPTGIPTGIQGVGTALAPLGAAAQASQPTDAIQVNSQQEYDALAPGTIYVDSRGRRAVKR